MAVICPADRTGHAIALRPISRSPPAWAHPRRRLPSLCAWGLLGSVMVLLVYGASTLGATVSEKARKTLPVAVACGMLGRPSSATLRTEDGLWTKSTVMVPSR